MTTELPPLPAADRIMWQYGQQIDHYSPAQMRAYAAEAARLARQQALEDAALMCDRRFLLGGDDDAVSVDIAAAIRELKDRT